MSNEELDDIRLAFAIKISDYEHVDTITYAMLIYVQELGLTGNFDDGRVINSLLELCVRRLMKAVPELTGQQASKQIDEQMDIFWRLKVSSC